MENLNDMNDQNMQNIKRAIDLFQRIVKIKYEKLNKLKINPGMNKKTGQEKTISKDDVINLKILLEKTNNIEDFIKNI